MSMRRLMDLVWEKRAIDLARQMPASEEWVWECRLCPDMVPRPCGSEAEAAFLGRQHDQIHHGISLGTPGMGIPTGPQAHRIGLPDFSDIDMTLPDGWESPRGNR